MSRSRSKRDIRPPTAAPGNQEANQYRLNPTDGALSRAPRSWIKKSTLRPAAFTTMTVILVCTVWDVVVRGGLVDPIILPPPFEVVRALWDLGQQAFFWAAIRVTLIETLLGFLIGSSVGWLLGMAVALSTRVRDAVYPIIVAFQNTPRIALAPVFLTWFGFGMTARIVMSAVICFFPVVIAVVVGMQNVDDDNVVLMRSYGATRWQTYRKVIFPSSLPILFSGLKTAMTLALLGAIVGEFVGGSGGMGVLIKTFNFQLNVAEGFAAITALMIIGMLLYGIVELIDRRVVFWRGR